MDTRSCFSIFFIGFCFIGVVGCFDSLMDNVYFDIKWPGPEESLQSATNHLIEDGSVLVITNNKEKYRCILPTVLESDNKETDDTVSSPLELDLLKSLFDQTVCTYRLETYWTYELCHGRHLRQYHEEKEMGKKPKMQEYFLGRYKMETFHSDYQAEKNRLKSDKKQNTSKKIQKVQGIEIPYYEIVYTDGTFCELTGQPRKAFLHYVCQPDGRGEIYELKETSSCEYEVVVLTNQLCSHPAYGPKKEQTNAIHCHALEGSPKQPKNLELLKLESTFEQFNGRQFWEDDSSQTEDLDSINSLWDLVGKIIKEHGLLDVDPDVSQSESPAQRPKSESTQVLPTRHPPTDSLIQKEFFEGSFCIEGGAGWWKHKFCYGKHVMQFHVDTTHRNFIVLGEWNEDAHVRWLNANTGKRPRPLAERKFITQFYGDGDVCELTGKRRSVEVKLRCIVNPEHPNSVAIFLSEPRTCEYLLQVESPILCDLVSQADNNGLILNPKL